MTQAILAAALGAALSAGLTAGLIVYIGRAIRAESRQLTAAAIARARQAQAEVLEAQEAHARQAVVLAGDQHRAIAELADRLERAVGGRYVGRYVIAHTPAPDDQSLRGWVRAEHRGDDGVLALELTSVDYLDPATGDVVASMTEAIVERVSWVQLLEPPTAD